MPSAPLFDVLARPIRSWSTPRTMLILFGLLLLFVPAFVILKAGIGVPTPPDAMFGYSAEQAYRAFDAEEASGRRYHLIFQVLDLLLIPVYASLFATTIAYTFQRLFGRGSPVVNLGIVVPVLAGLVDYAENVSLLTLLWTYPEPLLALAAVSGVLTMLKWALVGAGCSLALLGLFGIALQAARDAAFKLVVHIASR
jgi:hypothetical protein